VEIIKDVRLSGTKTILCIDDDDGMLRYQKALFERGGYEVLTAASARQGLRIAAVCAVAAVIVDYHMREMNSHEVATEIKAPQATNTDSHDFQRRRDSRTRIECGRCFRF
jgi:CheY-like chemotaxis protein